jgi:hypothetical protein
MIAVAQEPALVPLAHAQGIPAGPSDDPDETGAEE